MPFDAGISSTKTPCVATENSSLMVWIPKPNRSHPMGAVCGRARPSTGAAKRAFKKTRPLPDAKARRLCSCGPAGAAASNRALKVVNVSGSARERGLAHGAQLRDRIHSCWSFYHKLFKRVGWTDPELKRACAAVKRCMGDITPDINQELIAVAEAAGIEEWKVYALNARTEIVNGRRILWPESGVNHAAHECTSTYSPASRVLAQNWDWEKVLEDLFVVMRVTLPSNETFVMMTEPGIVGKVGFNSQGVGVCLNLIANSNAAKWGGESRNSFTECIPVHILLRLVLESSSFEDALKRVRSAPRCEASMSNLFIADAQGQWSMCELNGNGASDIDTIGTDSKTNFLPVHTNHYVGCGLADVETGNDSSHDRLARASAILGTRGPRTLNEVKTLLADRAGENPILRHYVPVPELQFDNAGTCCAVAMELDKRVMHVTPGNPLHCDYVAVPLRTVKEDDNSEEKS